MSKTPSDPSSRDLIQYHMFDLSIYYGLRYNFQISNSSTLWDTAASFMAVACIFQNIHMIFHTHHSCNSDLLYATSKPQKTHLMSHKGLYPTVENTSCMLNSSFGDFTTDFLFFFLSLPLYFRFSQTLGCHWKTQPVSFSHVTHSGSRVLCVD